MSSFGYVQELGPNLLVSLLLIWEVQKLLKSIAL